MTNPIEQVGGLTDSANVPKADVIAWAKARVRQRFPDVDSVRAATLSGQTGGIYVTSTQGFYDLDTSDTISADNGVTVIRDASGNCWKLIGFSIGKRVQVRAATTANVTIATGLNNGDILDGVTLATGDLVLVKDQTSPAENGVYVVGASPARHVDFDTYDDYAGALVTVVEGTVNASTLWFCSANEGGTLDTTAISFTKIVFTAPGGDVTGPGSASDGNVVTFNGATGKVIQDSGLALTALAPKASPVLTGTPTAPTPAAADNSTKLATTAYVDRSVPADLALTLAQHEMVLADFANTALFLGAGGNRFADSFDTTTYVDVANALGTDTAIAGLLKNVNIPAGTTSYAGRGGSGNRAGMVTVTSSGITFGGDTAPQARFVDGDKSANVFYFAAGSNTGAEFIKIDFGAPRLLQEARWYQNTAATHGTWKWQGSGDDVTYADVGASFTLGGGSQVGGAGPFIQTITAQSANTAEYRYWKLVAVSGTRSDGPYLYEIEFKIGRACNPSYANAGGIGDRTASITVTSAGIPIFNENNLVNGSFAPDTVGSNWFTSTLPAAGGYIRFDFGAGAQKRISEAKWYQSSAVSHGTWKWQVFSDASVWIDISSNFTLGGATVQTQAFDLIGSGSYSSYQLAYVSGSTDPNPFLHEIEFKIDDAPPLISNISVNSVSLTALTAPSTIRLLAFVTELDAITLNADLIMSVSRDAGANYVTATLSDLYTVAAAAGNGAYHVLDTGDIDVSGTPSGTAVRWKLATANFKRIECLAVAAYWK